MKGHPQFNETQACHSSMFCYKNQNNFFSCLSQIRGKNQLCQKKNMYFSIYESNELKSNELFECYNLHIIVSTYHTFKITENATGKEI